MMKSRIYEFYVPWWAWPCELLHRLCFGRMKIVILPPGDERPSESKTAKSPIFRRWWVRCRPVEHLV